jgi:hypothetical protein
MTYPFELVLVIMYIVPLNPILFFCYQTKCLVSPLYESHDLYIYMYNLTALLSLYSHHPYTTYYN